MSRHDSRRAQRARNPIIAACLLLVLSLLPLASGAAEHTDSLLGKPVSTLVGSLDRCAIEVDQARGAPLITSEAARYALEHSELLDPTLPEVRNNAFPLIAVVHLKHRENTTEVVARLHFCGGLGVLHGRGPVPYVFRYRLPIGNEKKSGPAEPVAPHEPPPRASASDAPDDRM